MIYIFPWTNSDCNSDNCFYFQESNVCLEDRLTSCPISSPLTKNKTVGSRKSCSVCLVFPVLSLKIRLIQLIRQEKNCWDLNSHPIDFVMLNFNVTDIWPQ